VEARGDGRTDSGWAASRKRVERVQEPQAGPIFETQSMGDLVGRIS
jgi:hypothetical protein